MSAKLKRVEYVCQLAIHNGQNVDFGPTHDTPDGAWKTYDVRVREGIDAGRMQVVRRTITDEPVQRREAMTR